SPIRARLRGEVSPLRVGQLSAPVGFEGVSVKRLHLSTPNSQFPTPNSHAPPHVRTSAPSHFQRFGSYCNATAPEPNSFRPTSFKSTCFDSPANSVGPCPASRGCTTISYSSINPSSANACPSLTPATASPLPGCSLRS